MRPPMLMLLAGDVPAAWYPGPLPANPWQHKIKNALYDPADERVLIQASDGVWRGRADLSGPFTRINLPAPIFVMGATVFDTQPNGSLSGRLLQWPLSGRSECRSCGQSTGR